MAEQAPPKISIESGSAIKPQYAVRSMKCYAVTESELKHIGLANLGQTASFGIGSALIAFGLDIFKDTRLAEQVPESAALVVSTVEPLCFIFGIVFWFVSATLWVWRRDMLATIREESDS